jgi:hypothetical protein
LRSVPQCANGGDDWEDHVTFRLGNGVSVSKQSCPEQWLAYFEKLVDAVRMMNVYEV